jgi:hypothetical protein
MIVGAASAQLAEQEEADLARDIEAELSHAIGRAPSGLGSNEPSPET